MHEGNVKAEGKERGGLCTAAAAINDQRQLLVTLTTLFQLSSLQISLPSLSFSQTSMTLVPVIFKIQIRISPVEFVSHSCPRVWSRGSR
jgi:hypothetical protein